MGESSPARPGRRTRGAPAAAVARVLVVTDDADLLDDLVRLAAAAGTEVEVASSAPASRASWRDAPLVVVCDDLLGGVLGLGLPRRPDVVVVAAAAAPELWQQAVGLGAEQVVVLPQGEAWLVDRLADAAAGPSREAPVVAAVGGRGGAGASTLAASVALAATRQGARALLIDADPLGGGLDLVLGAEDVAGLRWPDLAHTHGRLAPAALDEALPRPQALTVLSWDRSDLLEVAPEAMAAVLSAGVRGFDLVVVDLPRRPDAAAREALARAALTWLVVPLEVRAVASAGRVAAGIVPLTSSVQVVARGPAPTGLEPDVVSDTLGLPLAATVRGERGLDALLDRGSPLRTRGPLAQAARILCSQALAARPEVAA